MRILYTTKVTAVGGRTGRARSVDGRLDVALSKPPGLGGRVDTSGTNPEQLFGAAYSACFQGSLDFAARRQQLPEVTSVVTAHVEIGRRPDNQLALQVRLEVEVSGTHEETAKTLVDEAHQLCPFSNAIRGNIDVTTTLVSSA